MTESGTKTPEVASEPLRAKGIETLQMNLGYVCNMACKHCHFEAGPHRTELMEREIIEKALQICNDHGVKEVDLTGGSPELNPSFRHLVSAARRTGVRVLVRSNLTILLEAGMEDLPDFLARHDVEVTASLPHYTEAGTDRLRGSGTFSKSIEALRRLNVLGYGMPQGKQLNLVYNPPGAFLPGCQTEIEEQFRKDLFTSFGVVFTRLYALANMPIGRFREFLVRTHNLESYMEKMHAAFNPATLDGLMCRSLLSVGWDGTLYDCDFNQALGLPVDKACPTHINDFDYAALDRRRIMMGNHCFVCTAGRGAT